MPGSQVVSVERVEAENHLLHPGAGILSLSTNAEVLVGTFVAQQGGNLRIVPDVAILVAAYPISVSEIA